MSNINFKIRKGEKVAFLGKSCSGKSTIINLIMKIYQLNNNQGEIFFKGMLILCLF